MAGSRKIDLGEEDYTEKLLPLHLAGRNVLQMEKGNSAVSERDVSHCPHCALLATRSDIAQLLGTETRGALLKSRGTSDHFFVSVLRGW